MLVAVAFAKADSARKVAQALARQGVRTVAMRSGAAVLRRAEAVTHVVCGLRLEDMTAPRLRQLLPAHIPVMLLAPGTPDLAGIEALPAGITGAQLAQRLCALVSAQDAAVARAKRALIRHMAISEAQAHHLLQKRAMDGGVPLLRAAQDIIEKFGEDD